MIVFNCEMEKVMVPLSCAVSDLLWVRVADWGNVVDCEIAVD